MPDVPAAHVVVPDDPSWPAHPAAQAARLSGHMPVLHRIDRAPVPARAAGPTIDLRGVLPDAAAVRCAIAATGEGGVEARGARGLPGRRRLEAGRRLTRLQLVTTGSPHVARHLAFRDRLRAHAGHVAEQGAHKLAPAMRRGPGPADHVADKDAFVRAAEAAALIRRAAQDSHRLRRR